MSVARDIALIDELRSLSAETTWVEFKRNNSDPDAIGKRCSALSNGARLDGRDCAYMLWGIDDATHEVVGTGFDPNVQTVGAQVLQLWLANSLKPSVAFDFRVVQHPQGRVVLLETPQPPARQWRATTLPTSGSATPRRNLRTIRSAISY